MIGQDVIDDVRDAISDAVAPYRWGDPKMLRYVNDIQREILRQHPEAAYASTIVVTAFTEAGALTETLTVNDNFKLPMVHGVSAMCLGEDSEDAANMAKANDHWQKFLGFMM